METFSALLARCEGNPSAIEAVFRDAGDLRHHRAHYDVTVNDNDDVMTWNAFRIAGP